MSHPTPHSADGSTWSVLRFPAFRWMFMAQAVSFIGSWMQLAAISWHIYELTGDAAALGLVGLVRVVPIILLSLFGGVVADAYDRRKLMIVVSLLMGVIACVMAVFTFSGGATVGLLYLLTAALSAVSAFDKPAWQALMPNLVPREYMSSAVRVNVVLVELSLMIGPVLAGIVLARAGAGAAYLINGLSFIPVVLTLLLVKLPPMKPQERVPVTLDNMLEGLRFVRRTPLLWSTMSLDFIATFFSSAMALLPIYAADVLRVGEEGYGLLYAAPSIGAVVGSVAMAHFAGRIKQQGKLLLWSVAAYGAATIVFGLSNIFWLSMFALAFAGLADAISMVIRNAIRLLVTPDHLRGRMLGVNMVFFMGGPQLGEFEAGIMARAFGAPFSVISGGIGTIIAVAAMAAGLPILRQYREGDLVAPQPAAAGEIPAEAVPVPTAAGD
ncbi:MAG: MFS transporter [Pleurocapsa minor GSE-CHR-MK-17-07R]|jgi:MFS family permease|nr:MFS transporter [Pleurocapsa minor GSE-CHR-MK 17-07R]